ncbi:MAG: hypothetical protein EPN22_14175 [Nitrospirae bacterium]|nr:MAG: hypothetical protein EPN22_14175 [Nitrospirota bacterium]
MGKKFFAAAFLMIFLAMPPQTGADTSPPARPQDFAHFAPINGSIVKGSLYRTELPEEVLRKCASDCGDLRIFDQDGLEIPYVIIENRMPRSKTEAYNAEIISYKESDASAELILKLPEKFNPVNRLVINTTDRDFSKKLVLYGSHDMKKWDLLADAAIYDFSSRVSLRKTDVLFDKSDCRYLKMRIEDDGAFSKIDKALLLKYDGLDLSVITVQQRKLRIGRIEARSEFEGDTATVYDEAVLKTFTVQLDKDRNTVVEFESKMPFYKIFFDIANQYYFRKATIKHSDTGDKNSFKIIGTESIYRFPLYRLVETKNYVERQVFKAGSYRIEIENKNNPPPDIREIKLSWIRKRLYFVALDNARGLALYVGGSKATKPDYDLPRFINQDNWFKHDFQEALVDVSQIKENPDFKSERSVFGKAWFETKVFSFIVVLLVVGLGYWLYALSKKWGAKETP